MKNHTKFLSLTLLTLLIATACSQQPASKAPVIGGTTKETPTQQQQPAAVTEGTMGVPTSRFGTNMKCDVLKDTEAQQRCEMQINDMIGSMLESEITASYDVGRCKELPADVATRCQERLNETGVKGPVTMEEVTLFDEITRGTPNEDIENRSIVYDSTRCAELKTAGYKEYCEKSVTERVDQGKFSEIIRSKDKVRCGELATESLKNDCKRFFGEEVVVTPVPTPAPEVTEVAPEVTGN